MNSRCFFIDGSDQDLLLGNLKNWISCIEYQRVANVVSWMKIERN